MLDIGIVIQTVSLASLKVIDPQHPFISALRFQSPLTSISNNKFTFSILKIILPDE